MTSKLKILLYTLLTMSCVGSAMGQDYYDDIYYNPTKQTAPKQSLKKPATTTNPYNSAYDYNDYPSADSYTPAGNGLNMSVDEYNRRGMLKSDSLSATGDSLTANFSNTRRIERFHNPSVVNSLSEQELAEYYSTPSTVNIIVNSTSPWAWGYGYYPYYTNPWYPWYPSYAWGWGPSWSWSWGWGPTWGWGPSLSWNWGWGPAWSWAPSRPGWSTRPHSTGNIRPGYRPGGSNGYRPSSTGNNGYRPGGNAGYRPGRGNVRGSSNVNPYQRPSNNDNYNSGFRRGSSHSSTPSWGNGNSGYRGGSNGGGFSRGGGGGRGRH